MQIEKWAALALTLMTFGALAQPATDSPDWKEAPVPLPPAFNQERLIPLEMPAYVSLRLGIDPASLSISSDGVVRYVVVASSASGALNAMYEGIRCATWEVKTYARYSTSGQWAAVQEPKWVPLNGLPSKHALALARQGACENGGSTPARSVTAIVTELKSTRQIVGE